MDISYFKNLRGARIATIETETKPNKNVDLVKVSKTQVILGSYYVNALNNRLKLEGLPLHKPNPRKWGTRVGCVIEHNGKYYLETQFVRSLSTTYYLNGQIAPFSAIKQYLPNKPAQKVIFRDYSFDNIKSVSVNGKHFVEV